MNRISSVQLLDDLETQKVNILDIGVHKVNMSHALALMTSMADGDQPHHVVTVNPEFVMLAHKDNAFKEVLNGATLSLPDGVGILWAARLLGDRIPERITGVDTVRALAGIARDKGHSIFLLGAAPGVAEKAARVLQTEYPGLIIAGTHGGSPHPAEEDGICSLIEAARPSILLVAYGPPRQDLWIARTKHRLRIPVAMGVGGTFDFIAGKATRAPQWIRTAGFEWLHRLIREPRRWRRMLSLPLFVFFVFRERLSKMKP